ADPHVVADLDLVIELHALLDHRVVDRAAVDRGVGADLDVVADVHAANLGDLDPAALVLGDADAVAADHRAGVNDGVRADRAARIDHHPGIKRAVLAD